jgi:hypothetical protein
MVSPASAKDLTLSVKHIQCKGLFGSNETASVYFYGFASKSKFNLRMISYKIKRYSRGRDFKRNEIVFNQNRGSFFKIIRNLNSTRYGPAKTHVRKFKNKQIVIPRGKKTEVGVSFGRIAKDSNNCSVSVVF